MTEDEAKTKWCPFVHESGRVYGKYSGTVQSCIGSECQAWRWLNQGHVGYFEDGSAVEGDGEVERGFCGLAGKP